MVFLTIAATAAFVSALVFTIAPVYRFRTAGLDNLQLVLVGTVMEAAVFLFEIPTGIVADRWSRKWSVVIGHAGIGVGLLDRGNVRRRSPACSSGQAVWGLAYTFTSGATVAWLAGELGDPDSGGAAHGCSCAPAGSGRWPRSSPCRCRSCSASTSALRAPLIIGGCCRSPRRSWLTRAMGEEHFAPVAADAPLDAGTAMGSSAAAGVRVIRASHVLLFLHVALFLAGGASEAYDRYIEKFLLGLDVPGWPGWSSADLARASSAGCPPRSASSCRGGSSGATPTSMGGRAAALDRRA